MEQAIIKLNTRAIDYITEDFYESLSFTDGEMPNFEAVKELFYEDSLLTNLSFGKPVTYSAESFLSAMNSQIADGQLTQFMQRELYSKTEIFGKIAQRASVYEYSLSYYETDNPLKGVNYMHFIQVNDLWRITSMAWHDESTNNLIPRDFIGY